MNHTHRPFRLFRTLFLVAAVLLIGYLEFARPALSADPTRNMLLHTLITRLLGAGAVFFLLLDSASAGSPDGLTGGNVFRIRRMNRAGLILTLAALVSLNNGPWIGLLTGAAKVTAPASDVLLLAAESLAIGLFEELAFRGLLLPLILEKYPNRTFAAVFVSSAVFAAVHLVNLADSAPGAVILQVGYSFLIGGMCAAVLLEWSSVWLCALLHGIYDFCGALVPMLGEGKVWDPATVTLTAVLGVIAAAVFIWVLLRFDKENPMTKTPS